MYPQGELKFLVAHKAHVERKIARERGVCVEAIGHVAEPLEWIEQAQAHWHWIAPLFKFVALPLGVLAKRAPGKKVRLFGALLRWGPLVMNLWRGFKKTRAESDRTADAV